MVDEKGRLPMGQAESSAQTEPQDPLANAGEDLIGSATTVEEIIRALAQRGCADLTSSIDLGACSKSPCANGGFCDVYRGALHDNHATEIAIKSLRICHGQGDPEGRKVLKRAARELYHWSKLQHPNVLPLMGFAIFREQLSMVSEWMANGNMVSYVNLKHDVNRKRLCMDICEGLCYIHMKGMVHGDLKAVNVMVSDQGIAMITDFGNTQLKDVTLRFSHTKNGGLSVRWAAPELLLDDNGPQVSKEADVYACGMTMLETLTGKVPYEGIGDHRVYILVAVEKKLPIRPDVGVDDNLWDLLNSCWTRDPSERPKVAIIKDRLQALFWPPYDERLIRGAGHAGVAMVASGVGGALIEPQRTGGGYERYERDSDRDSTAADTVNADYQVHVAATAGISGDYSLSLPGPGSAVAAAGQVPRIASRPAIQSPAQPVIARDFVAQEEEDYDDSDEDGGTLWQVPKQNPTPAASTSTPSGGAPFVRRTATRPKGLRLRIDGTRPASQTDSSPASTEENSAGATLIAPTLPLEVRRKTTANAGSGNSGGGDVASRPPFVSHQSSARGSQTWDIRPQAEEVYEQPEQFSPKRVIDAPSGGAPPVTTEPPPVSSSTPTLPVMGPGVRRNKKPIRVVAAERKKMLERINAAKIQQPTVKESMGMPDSTSTAGTVVPVASIFKLRKRSTKMWGGRVEEVPLGTALGTGVFPNVPETNPEGPGRQRPTFKWVKGQLIGEGSFARVYHAMNLTTGEMIAVKQVQLLKTDSDRNDSRQMSVDALKSESDILRDLDHPRIVQYLGTEETADTFSIFLEYVSGGSVGSVLRKFGKFEDLVVRSFSHQIIDGLAYLHKSGILHRDLKADNILVDPLGICKISSFGISTQNEHAYNNFDGTATLMQMQGSVFWMAPEMLHNNKQGYSAKIDIWSVGCVVLEMQAGRRPWTEEEMVAVMYKVGSLRQAPPVPDDVHLTPLADDFRTKCFAVDPADRPTAAELLTHPWLQVPPGWVFGGFNEQP